MTKKLLQWFAERVLWIAAWVLCATIRVTKNNATILEDTRKQNKSVVIVFWHGSMLLGWFFHRPSTHESVAALVSRSRDGEILSATLGHWGYTLIRGSSHVGGKEAMQSMVDAVTSGNSLCITPDGPRGPRRVMKMGAVRAAQRARVPLVLVGIAVHPKSVLESWDRFEVPLPFARAAVCYSSPIVVPENLKDKALDDFLRATEDRMHETQAQAERLIAASAS